MVAGPSAPLRRRPVHRNPTRPSRHSDHSSVSRGCGGPTVRAHRHTVTGMTMNGQARVVLVANQKGGVGKSTTVAAIAEMIAAAGKRGRRVLVVDGDPQANVTVEDLGVDGDGGQSLAQTLQFGAH